MLKRISILAALAFVATLALGALGAARASAEEPSPAVFLRGAGVLDARGDGLVAVKGAMDYEVSAEGGVLLVHDSTGNALVRVEGEGRVFEWNGFRVYAGFGSAHIVGRDVAVIVAGNDINLHVRGRGWAYLKGDGTYTVNGGEPHPWTQDGAFAGLP